MPKLNAAEVNELVKTGVRAIGLDMQVTEIGEGSATLTVTYEDRMERPGGSIGGPVMMTLADAAIYAAILGELGPELMAMTTSLNFNFLRRARQCSLTADAKILKLGSRLAIVEVLIHDSEGSLVCHATGTYSLPPRRSVQDAANDELAASSAKVDKALAALQLGDDVDDGAPSSTSARAESPESPESPPQAPPAEAAVSEEDQELSTSDLLALMDDKSR